MSLSVKDSSVWKAATPYVKDAGVWKPCDGGFVKDAGVWKQHYTPPPTGPVIYEQFSVLPQNNGWATVGSPLIALHDFTAYGSPKPPHGDNYGIMWDEGSLASSISKTFTGNFTNNTKVQLVRITDDGSGMVLKAHVDTTSGMVEKTGTVNVLGILVDYSDISPGNILSVKIEVTMNKAFMGGKISSIDVIYSTM